MKTLVIGASENPVRYSNKAIRMLRKYHHEVLAVGLREGVVSDVPIYTTFPEPEAGIDTVTMYVGAARQPALYQEILKLRPRRLIFNPGSENPEFEQMLEEKGIDTERACTLVLLQTGQY